MSSDCARNWQNDAMTSFRPDQEPNAWGTWEDAVALRRWSFARRTPEQRLAWLEAALELAYQSGALKPRRPAPPQADVGTDELT